MDTSRLRYLLHSGKNPKWKYYLRSYASLYTPQSLLKRRIDTLLKSIDDRNDCEYILRRVDYYCRLSDKTVIDRERWAQEAVAIRHQPMTNQSVYYLDSMTIARYFPLDMRWKLLPGDINYVPDVPSIVKSRPIVSTISDGDEATTADSKDAIADCKDNSNAVIMNLDKVRHFIFIDDKKPFADKKDAAIFRGKVKDKPNRLLFMNMFYGDRRIDVGSIDRVKDEWQRPKMSLYDHLDYRYIMSLEGNDVASNLKWVMSSNSIAVMPKPKYETWFMEGLLKPDFHYIEVKPDYSDLKQKLDYYSAHIDEAKSIIANANKWVSQFKDAKRELIISLLVLQKYLYRMNE